VLGADDRWAIAALVAEWQRAFDRHDWEALTTCLTPSVSVDYSGLRGVEPAAEPAAVYADRRRRALDHLDLQHNHSNLVISAGQDAESAIVECNFQIFRFEPGGHRHFHSWGVYRLLVRAEDPATWRIAAIEQLILRNEGDSSLHKGMGGASGV
jgi:hypothetical protein